MTTRALPAFCVSSLLFLPAIASSAVFEGVEFPAGADSFADRVTDYRPLFSGGPPPDLRNQETFRALGPPRRPSDLIDVSLGNGGRLELQFTDNSLTGSGDARPDLWIFEVGSNYGVLDEAVYVEISRDGEEWYPVGIARGGTSGLDIDALGFGPQDRFSFVALTDDGDSSGSGAVGADIDAVGASSSGLPVAQGVSELVAFEPVAGSHRSTAATVGCGADAVGTFQFDATLTNTSKEELSGLRVRIESLTNGNRILTPEGLLDTGQSFSVRGAAAYSDGLLAPGESTRVHFVICLRSWERFRLFVDVLAIRSADAPDARPYDVSFNMKGIIRRARIHLSSESDPAPVLIYFHGWGGNTSEGEYWRRFHDLWPEAHVIYAQAACLDVNGTVTDATPGCTPGWSIRHPYYALLGQTEDLDYVQALLDHLRRTRKVDEGRLFAAGFSSGGFFTFSLMEHMADQFDGFAVVGAHTRYKVDMDIAALDKPPMPPILPLLRGADRARHPRPVLYMFGSQDTVFKPWHTESYGWTGWEPTIQSLSRLTLEQLIIRNDTEPADFDMNRWQEYWGGYADLYPGNPDGRVFLPLNEDGARVVFRPFVGPHGWPSTAYGPQNQWTIDFFKGL